VLRCCPSIRLSVCLSPKCKNSIFSKTKQFRCYGLYWRPVGSRTWAFQRTHYWTHKIQDGWDPPSWKSTWRHFFSRGWSDLDKMSVTGAEWHVDCGDVVEIESRCRILIWRTFGRIQWHVIPEPRITLQGAATWWIYCHDSRATCHIAGCKNSIRHIENRFSSYLIFFVSSPIHFFLLVVVTERVCHLELLVRENNKQFLLAFSVWICSNLCTLWWHHGNPFLFVKELPLKT